MPGTIPAARQQLIAAIANKSRALRATMPLAPFVRDYYRGVDESDLRGVEPAALAAAAAAHLRFGMQRKPGRALVRVFNPSLEKDGWTTPQTVVEVVTDDMPFLVDSLAMVVNASGLSIHAMAHPVFGVRRDRAGRLREVLAGTQDATVESWQHIEVDHITDAARIDRLRERIEATLDDVRVSVADWPRMVARARELAASVADNTVPGIDRPEAEEASAFLTWLADNHFTFLGYREYTLDRGATSDRLIPVPRSGMGLLRTGAGRPRPRATELRGEVRRQAREPALLVVTKANAISTVHRATYLDYIGVKMFGPRGRVIGERRFMLVGHRKGRTTKERLATNFGCAHPEGYRKALRKMRLAEKLNLPIVSLINTPGAYPGIGAEERGQSEAIGRNLYEMAALATPIIVTVIGEGGSGGALAIAVGDATLMLQYATYSVISPEGCASILWKSAERAPEAAESLGITAPRLKQLGFVDRVVNEPPGGAHRDPPAMMVALKKALGETLRHLSELPLDALLGAREERLLAYGKFKELGS